MGSKTLIIAFAGMAGLFNTFAAIKQQIGIETRPFEFVHSLQDKECDVLFLRDRHRAYYHSGVKGVGRNVDEVADFLNGFVDKRQYKSVVTLGHSMGGYASILFASKINADICMAISPPTFLDVANRTKYEDERYAHEKAKLCRQKPGSAGYFDLRKYFLSEGSLESSKRCAYFLFYGGKDRLDRIHADRMIGVNNSFTVFEVADADHNAARGMRELGILSRLHDSIISSDGCKGADSLLKAIKMEHSIRQQLTPHKSS